MTVGVLDRGSVCQGDDRLLLLVIRQQLEARASLVLFNSSGSLKPPIHGLLALAARSSDDCFHAKEWVILLGDENVPANHPAKQGLVLHLPFLSLPC